MESSIIILNSFNGNFYFSNPARNNNPVRILVMQYKTLQCLFQPSCLVSALEGDDHFFAAAGNASGRLLGFQGTLLPPYFLALHLPDYTFLQDLNNWSRK